MSVSGKPLLGSIINCGDRRRQVCVPVDRNKETGKLVYLYKTVAGRKSDAIAYRDDIVASVPPERLAPAPRVRQPRKPKPEARLRLEELFRQRIGTHETKQGAAKNPEPYEMERNALSSLPLSKFSDRELLRVMKHHLKFYPSRRFTREICKRGLWRWAFAEPVFLRHVECFIEVVEQAPYHNQTALNRQCRSIVEAGIIDYLRKQLADIANLRLRAGTISIFQRDPGVRIPQFVAVPDEMLLHKMLEG